MMKLEPFKIEHLSQLEKQRGHSYPNISLENRRCLELSGYNYSIKNDVRVFICGGVLPYWANRVEAWAIFDKNLDFEFLKVHRICKRYLDVLPHKRIECVVKYDFQQGNRWANLLGFQVEGPRLRSYFEDGKDAILYSRIKAGE
jgi:hypothetical protein